MIITAGVAAAARRNLSSMTMRRTRPSYLWRTMASNTNQNARLALLTSTSTTCQCWKTAPLSRTCCGKRAKIVRDRGSFLTKVILQPHLRHTSLPPTKKWMRVKRARNLLQGLIPVAKPFILLPLTSLTFRTVTTSCSTVYPMAFIISRKILRKGSKLILVYCSILIIKI